MAGSTYSTNLKIELMTTGENSGTWGDITNTNLGTALEQAVVGYGNPDYASDANLTISITNSNAAQPARALVLNVTSTFGSLTATRELVVPTIQKQYIVQNNTTGGQSITVKTSAGTGITVPNGRKAHLYVNGTDVIQMFDFVDINGGTIDGTAIGASSASTGAFTTLNASGATTLDGNVTLGNASGDTVTVTGTIASNLLFTDNTYDIGASGATRPRNLYLAGAATIGGNLSVGGTLTLTGGLILNGNVTVGDSSADTLTVNATITSNLLFTDNTYDIGASGATRPRNLFLAGNATIGGSQTLTGSLTVDSTTDSSSTTTGSIQTDGGLGVAKALYVGTTANIAGAVTLSGGTANGVTYLNGSKVLTSGSALTFDGTTLERIGSLGGFKSTATGGAAYTQLSSDGVYATGTDLYLLAPSGKFVSFYANGSEAMRLTSTLLYTASALNVAIGSSSVTAGTKFSVTGNNVCFSPNTSGKDTHTFSTGAADVGTYAIKSDTTTKVYLNAGGDSYFTGGILLVGKTSNATYAAGGALFAVNGAADNGVSIAQSNATGPFLTFFNSANSGFAGIAQTAAGTLSVTSTTALTFNIASTERGRFTTTGLDVTGTGSFTGDVTLGSYVASTNVSLNFNGVANKAKRIIFKTSGTESWLIGMGAASENDAFEIYNGNGQMALTFAKATSKAIFNSDVAIGNPSNVALSGWSSAPALQVGNSANFYGDGIYYNWVAGLSLNSYRSANAWYNTSASIPTGRFEIGNGGGGSDSGFAWYWGTGGTAGSAAAQSQLMKLTDGGNLGIGDSNPSNRLVVIGSAAISGGRGSSFALKYADWQIYNTSSGNNLTFSNYTTELVTITQAGTLLVGTNSTSGSLTNYNPVYAGSFKTAQGSVSTTSGVAATLFTAPAGFGSYFITVWINADDCVNYQLVAVLSTQPNGSAKINTIVIANLLTVSLSGYNVQATQNSGGSATVNYTATRIAA